ncbi:kielin/chordin-like protein [Pomacea canaliculata]|uniref:kielin/chordin-like protein n=1 Tax=Pomacea canaliculata TaxID=400727 RepID=UPI000D73D200|nr:kielin/chordin-like protein [Pomacea canaliculata]
MLYKVTLRLLGAIMVLNTCTGSDGVPEKRQACADSISNCENYGRAACTSYQAWAQHNCPKFCGFCSGGGQTPTDTCVDTLDNCAALGANVCKDYVEFSNINCQRTCNFCGTSSPSASGGACVDKLTNCADYDSSSCTGQYRPWAQDNCAKTCNLCSNTGSVTPHPGTTGTCADKLTNCASFDVSTSCHGQYEAWARDNCAKTCNLCSSTGTQGGTQTPGTQTFYSDVCYYKGQSYKEGQQWKDGCEKNCTCVDQRRGYYLCQDLCPTFSNVPPQCQMVKNPGECCSTLTNCPPTTGCEYKGEVHQQGQEWIDGCTYRCTCKDGTTGYYECQALCVQWNLLPSCTLNDPAPGKCCSTPNCPANVVINYPEGYTPM